MSGKSDGTWIDEQREIDAAQVGGERQRRQVRIAVAVDGNLVSERPAGRDPPVHGGDAAHPRIHRR